MNEKPSFNRAIEMGQELVVRISRAPHERGRVIKEFYAENSITCSKDEAHLALLYKTLAEGESGVKVPPWFAKAGYASATLTLVFLMLLIVASVFGHQVPTDSRFLVSLVFSLGASLAVAFLGGDMAATGKIP